MEREKRECELAKKRDRKSESERDSPMVGLQHSKRKVRSSRSSLSFSSLSLSPSYYIFYRRSETSTSQEELSKHKRGEEKRKKA